MLNKIVIPSILVVTILIAGIFALMPVERAGTVHTTIIAEIASAKTVSNTVILDGMTGNVANPVVVFLLDTTDVGNVIDGHVAVTLPITDDDSVCNGGEAAFAGLTIQAGVAPTFTDITPTAVAVTAGPDVDFDGDGGAEAVCVFHVDLDPTAVGGGIIVDVIFQHGAAGVLPEGSTITVTAELSN